MLTLLFILYLEDFSLSFLKLKIMELNLKERKGIILAGGTGSRLFPITKGVCKQLMPVYDKPMIYYPLSTLIAAGIREILIITTPNDEENFKRLLYDGSQLGIKIKYAVQERPNGLAEAFIIGSEFIGDSPVVLILGDNIFYGDSLTNHFRAASSREIGASIFAYPVKDPKQYGVVNFDKNMKVISIEEKPNIPKSRYAVTGIYFFDNSVIEKALQVKPSKRGELEITDLNTQYLDENNLNVELLGRGIAWLDTGNFNSLHEASSYIRALENRQGLKVGCPEEIAWRMGWINNSQLNELAEPLCKSGYGNYLKELLLY